MAETLTAQAVENEVPTMELPEGAELPPEVQEQVENVEEKRAEFAEAFQNLMMTAEEAQAKAADEMAEELEYAIAP